MYECIADCILRYNKLLYSVTNDPNFCFQRSDELQVIFLYLMRNVVLKIHKSTFKSQTLSLEGNFFKWDRKLAKIWHFSIEPWNNQLCGYIDLLRSAYIHLCNLLLKTENIYVINFLFQIKSVTILFQQQWWFFRVKKAFNTAM